MTAVLYVDDETTIQRAVQLWLARYGVTVHTAAGVLEAKLIVGDHHLDGVFLDVWLEDGSGLDVHDWLRVEHPRLARRTAFVTGDIHGRGSALRRARASGCPILTKPFDLEQLKALTEDWLRPRRDDGIDRSRDGSRDPPR